MTREWVEPELPIGLPVAVPEFKSPKQRRAAARVQYRWIKNPVNKCDECMALYAAGTPPEHGAQMERYIRYAPPLPSIRLCYLHHAQYREAEK
jgi:ribosomal protein L32